MLWDSSLRKSLNFSVLLSLFIRTSDCERIFFWSFVILLKFFIHIINKNGNLQQTSQKHLFYYIFIPQTKFSIPRNNLCLESTIYRQNVFQEKILTTKVVESTMLIWLHSRSTTMLILHKKARRSLEWRWK